MPSKYIVDAISGSAVGRVGGRGTLIISSSLEIAPTQTSILTSKHITGSISKTYTGEQFIRVTGAGSDSYDPDTGQWTIAIIDTSTGQVMGWTSPQAGMLNATGSIAIAGGELGTSFVASDVGSDVFFFVSGTVGSLNTTNTGSAVFGGDLYVSGNLNAVGSSQFTHLTGSLSRTITGQEFLNAVGAGSVAYNDTTGQWTITVPTGDFGDGSGVGWTSPHDGMLNATGSIALAGGELTNSLVASDVGADIFLFVSGTIGSRNTANTGSAVFGGDVTISGSLYASGNVGIGESNPTELLHLHRHTGNLVIKFEQDNANPTSFEITRGTSGLYFTRDGGNIGFGLNNGNDLDIFDHSSIIYAQFDALTQRFGIGSNFGTGVDTRPQAILDVRGDGSTRQVFLLSGSGGATDPDEIDYADLAFFVSGSKGSRGTQIKGTSLFGGDLHISGALTVDGLFPGDGADTNFFTSPSVGKINTTGSAVFAGGELGSSYEATTIGSDVFFFVSGTVGSINTSNTGSSVFGGDVAISGSAVIGTSESAPGESELRVEGSSYFGNTSPGAGSTWINDDGVIRWGASANFGTLTWDTDLAILRSQGATDLKLKAGTAEIRLFDRGETQVTGSFHMSGSSGSFNVTEFRISTHPASGEAQFTFHDAMVIKNHPDFEARSPLVCFGIEPEQLASNASSATFTFAEDMATRKTAGSGGGSDFFEADMQFWFSGSQETAEEMAYVSNFRMPVYNGNGGLVLSTLGGNSAANNLLSCSWATAGSLSNHAGRVSCGQDLHFLAGNPGPYDTVGTGQSANAMLSQTSSMILFRGGGLFIGRSYGTSGESRDDTPVGGILASGSTIFGVNTTATHRITGDTFITGSTTIRSSGKSHALFVDSSTDQVLILSGGSAASFDEASATDVSFYVSGSKTFPHFIPKPSRSDGGVAVFGGDVVISGSLYGNIGGEFDYLIIGSLMEISGTITAPTNRSIDISTAAVNSGISGDLTLTTGVATDVSGLFGSGDILIESGHTDGPTSGDITIKTGTGTSPGNIIMSTGDSNNGVFIGNGQVLIHSGGGPTSTDESNYADTNFFVSGSIGSCVFRPGAGDGTRGTAVFGGDVVISGSLFGGSPLVVGTDMVVSGNLTTDGSLFLSGSTFITGSTVVTGSLTVTGSFIVSGSSTFTVIGPSIFDGDATFSGSIIGGLPGDTLNITSSMVEISWNPTDLTDSSGPILRLSSDDSSVSTANPATLGSIEFYGSDDNASGVGAKIVGITDGTWSTGDNDHPTELQFWTCAENIGTPITQRMVIDKDGLIGIGTTVPSGTLDIHGDGSSSKILLLSGSGGKSSPDESSYSDVSFFVSGSILSRGTSNKGTSLFGGDLTVSGTTFLARGVGIGIEPGKKTAFEVADFDQAQIFLLTGSGGATSPNERNYKDINFFVSGTKGSIGTNTKGTALFGGDVTVSGSVMIEGEATFDDDVTFTSNSKPTFNEGASFNEGNFTLEDDGRLAYGMVTSQVESLIDLRFKNFIELVEADRSPVAWTVNNIHHGLDGQPVILINSPDNSVEVTIENDGGALQGNIFLAGGVDFVMGLGDTLTLIGYGNNVYETGRMVR